MRFIRLSLENVTALCLAVLLTLIAIAAEAAPHPVYEWRFDRSNDTQGWTGYGVASLNLEQGALHVMAAGNPSGKVMSPGGLGIPLDRPMFLRITIKPNSNAHVAAHIEFRLRAFTESSQTYLPMFVASNPDAYTTYTMLLNNAPRIAMLDVSPQSCIDQISLYFDNDTDIMISRIEIFGAAPWEYPFLIFHAFFTELSLYNTTFGINFMVFRESVIVNWMALFCIILLAAAVGARFVRSGGSRRKAIRIVLGSMLCVGLFLSCIYELSWLRIVRDDMQNIAGLSLAERIAMYWGGDTTVQFSELVKRVIYSRDEKEVRLISDNPRIKYDLLPLILNDRAKYLVLFNKDHHYDIDSQSLTIGNDLSLTGVIPVAGQGRYTGIYLQHGQVK